MSTNAINSIPEVVWKFDLSPIVGRLERRGVRNVRQLEAEFRKLAALWHLHPDECFAPSAELDEFWHEFILDTRRYREFCTLAFGEFEDHVTDDTRSGMWEPYERTKELYREHFGALDPLVWGIRGASSMNGPRIHRL